jgi:hypothetical protein
MRIDVFNPIAYIYECYDKTCNHTEEVKREEAEARDGKVCVKCNEHMRVIKGITQNNTKFSVSLSNEEHKKREEEHERVEQLRQQAERQMERNKRDRARQIDSEAQALGERTAHIQADIDSLSATNNKSNELFNILLETKPEAEKTLEVLGDTIINNNKRIVRRMKELEKIQAEVIDLLLEKNSISLDLKRMED